jgi:hypothetical protein
MSRHSSYKSVSDNWFAVRKKERILSHLYPPNSETPHPTYRRGASFYGCIRQRLARKPTQSCHNAKSYSHTVSSAQEMLLVCLF